MPMWQHLAVPGDLSASNRDAADLPNPSSHYNSLNIKLSFRGSSEGKF